MHGMPQAVVGVGAAARLASRDLCPAREHLAMGVHVVVQGQADLLQVVCALGTPSGLARGLDCRQEQGDQDANDGNDHQKLHQGEAPSGANGNVGLRYAVHCITPLPHSRKETSSRDKKPRRVTNRREHVFATRFQERKAVREWWRNVVVSGPSQPRPLPQRSTRSANSEDDRRLRVGIISPVIVPITTLNRR